MKDIDFLPAKYQEATAQLHAQWWRMAVLAMFAALVGLAVFGQYGIRLHAQGEIETLLPQYHAALAETQRLAKTEDAIRPNRAQAELLTYLRHPWPRTQILARIMAPLPDTIILRKLWIHRETPPAPPTTVTVAPPTTPAQPAAPDKLSPPERDLRKLREETDKTLVVVTLEGVTEEITTLHMYLGKLAAEGMFSKVEVASIESAASEKLAGSLFSVRLVVRPGYGQKGGPTSPPQGPAAAEQAAAAQGAQR
jgi:Tfp pilus assembly protein PilN